MRSLLWIVILVSSCLASAWSLQYGPSVEFLTRGGKSSSNRLRGKTLFLQEYPHYSVVIPLLEGKPSADSRVAYNYFSKIHFARFFVEAPPGYRIMAVVQSLDLVTNTGTMSKCLDHIMFVDLKTKNQSSNICGSARKTDLDYAPDNLVGPRYFFSSENEMAVDVFILSTSTAKTSDVGKAKRQLTMELAFTAFRRDFDCSNLTMISITGNSQLRSCSPHPDLDMDPGTTSDDGPYNCISSALFCDGVIDCAGTSDYLGFGADEQNCTEIRKQETAFYDMDESSIVAEVNYRRKLLDMENSSDTWIIHYAVIGLAGVVTSILIFSCLCYWGIWLFPAGKNKSSAEEGERCSQCEEQCGEQMSGGEGGKKTIFIEDHDLEGGPGTPVTMVRGTMTTSMKKFRSKSLAPLTIPATLKVNPDGSHSIEAYHGNRRLTISVN